MKIRFDAAALPNNALWLGSNPPPWAVNDVYTHKISYMSELGPTVKTCLYNPRLRRTVCTLTKLPDTFSPLCWAVNNTSNESVLVDGAWETGVGDEFYSRFGGPHRGGSKIPGSSGAAFAIGCRNIGATAKCLERHGYKWWWPDRTVPAYYPVFYLNGYATWRIGTYTITMDELHQACVREVRADYCGDGKSWTRDGNVINVADGVGIQAFDPNPFNPEFPDSPFTFEAAWTPSGATGITSELRFKSDLGALAHGYITDHCPDLLNHTTGYNASNYYSYDGQPPRAYVQNDSQHLFCPL